MRARFVFGGEKAAGSAWAPANDADNDDDDDDENVGDSGEGHDEKKTPAADQNSRYVYACVPNSVNR